MITYGTFALSSAHLCFSDLSTAKSCANRELTSCGPGLRTSWDAQIARLDYMCSSEAKQSKFTCDITSLHSQEAKQSSLTCHIDNKYEL